MFICTKKKNEMKCNNATLLLSPSTHGSACMRSHAHTHIYIIHVRCAFKLPVSYDVLKIDISMCEHSAQLFHQIWQ